MRWRGRGLTHIGPETGSYTSRGIRRHATSFTESSSMIWELVGRVFHGDYTWNDQLLDYSPWIHGSTTRRKSFLVESP